MTSRPKARFRFALRVFSFLLGAVFIYLAVAMDRPLNGGWLYRLNFMGMAILVLAYGLFGFQSGEGEPRETDQSENQPGQRSRPDTDT